MEDLNRKIIVEGFHLLSEQKGYTQVTVINKMSFLGIIVSTATFSRLIKNERGGKTKLVSVAEAIQIIIGIFQKRKKLLDKKYR